MVDIYIYMYMYMYMLWCSSRLTLDNLKRRLYLNKVELFTAIVVGTIPVMMKGSKREEDGGREEGRERGRERERERERERDRQTDRQR